MKQHNWVFIDISICKIKDLFVPFFVNSLCTLYVTYFELFSPWKMLLSSKNKVFRTDPNYIKKMHINWESSVIVRDKKKFKIRVFFKSLQQISDFLVFSVSLVEATEQNFTLLFLTENDLEGFTNCDKKINKVSFSVIVWCFIITIKLSNDYVKI